jgi:hypothetical protein
METAATTLATATSGLEIAAVLGTWGAVLVALYASVARPWWRAAWLRPRFELRCDSEGPFVRKTKLPSEGMFTWFLRASVSNIGRGPATNVRAVLVECTALETESAIESQLDIDPIELHWTSLPPAPGVIISEKGMMTQTPGIASSRIDLAGDDFEYVDLCRAYARDLIMVAHDDRPRGFSFASPSPRAEHHAIVRITCDEISATEFDVWFQFAFETHAFTVRTSVLSKSADKE